MTEKSNDRRPRTVVLHHDVGIGDLVFHLPYLRAIAKQSRDGKITLISRPTCRATDLLAHEECVEAFMEYDRWRKNDAKKGRHNGLSGMLRFSKELQEGQFERIVIFSDRIRYGFQAWLAGIPTRIGYGGFGWNWPQRFFLSRAPRIVPYEGPCVGNYQWATDLMLKHGFIDKPMAPRISVPEQALDHWKKDTEGLPEKRCALIVGASVKGKDWGWKNFSTLAKTLMEEGYGVICIGGPAEKGLLNNIEDTIPAKHQPMFQAIVPPSLLDCAALLKTCQYVIGNDTGVSNIAAACELPTLILLGNRPLLCQDPDIHFVIARSVADITPEFALERFRRMASSCNAS